MATKPYGAFPARDRWGMCLLGFQLTPGGDAPLIAVPLRISIAPAQPAKESKNAKAEKSDK